VMACLEAPSVARTMARSIDRLYDASDYTPRRRSKLRDAMSSFAGRVLRQSAAGGALEKAKPAPADDLQALLALQSADGWFDWNEQLVSKLIANWREWDHLIARSLDRLTRQPLSLENRITHTAIVLLILSTRFNEQEGLWRRAAQKAARWIAAVSNVSIADVQTWLKGIETQVVMTK
jgi:hypothetical protein